ncbi:MAG: c-type cytochrome domain-containing protein [Verrucomicrobiota bacterium]
MYFERKQPLSQLWQVPLACSPLVLLAFYPEVGDWTTFFGRFHPVVLHLPIGILLLTTLMEVLQVLSGGQWKFSTRLPLFLGAISAVAAMVLGILLMSGEKMEGALIESHFNWGIATAVGAVLALTLRCLPQYNITAALPACYRGTLILTCGILTWASHQGASITHGETYLTDHIPWKSDAPSAEEVELASGLSLETGEKDIYQHVVVPIFQSKCYDCHMTTKFKGELVMDTYEGLIKGGSTDAAIIPNDVEYSYAMERIHLPLDDEEHMPPANEPQMSAEEIQLIEWWINHGAPPEGKVASFHPDTSVTTAIESVSQTLLLEMETAPTAEIEYKEPTVEEIAESRAPLANAMLTLQDQYTGLVRYRHAMSNQIIVSSYNHQWTDQEILDLQPIVAKVTELILPRSQLTAASTEVINQMITLEVLDLRDTTTDDRFVQALNLPSLQRLNLFQTQVTPAAIDALASMSSLRSLTLSYTEFDQASIAQLQQRLPDCEIHFEAPVLQASSP